MPTNIESHPALVTDLYELTMAAGYFENGLTETIATFELFVREMPPDRGYLIYAGLEGILDYLERLKFTPDEIEYLRAQPVFGGISDAFFDYLKNFSFTGEAWSMAEGAIFFPGEPVLTVTAPLIEAQILETYLLCEINFQSMIATKASRVCHAAQGRAVVDFGARRAHGPEAGLKAARAAYIGGIAATSEVLAGFTWGVPISGTQAHSFTLAFDSEIESFKAFHKSFPDHTTLLIDTYDTLEAAKLVKEVGSKVKAVRLDSGDLVELSKAVRKILDQTGMKHVKIFASGDLDEYAIEDLISRGARLDAFGVGTKLATSADAPYLGGVYKLVELERDGKIIHKAKFSEAKATYPGKKMPYRLRKAGSKEFDHDEIGLANEEPLSDEPLLKLAFKDGKSQLKCDIHEARSRFADEINHLPEIYKKSKNPASYQVVFTEAIKSLYSSLKPK